MRTCVIFNPTAKGNKARHFRERLTEFGAECTLKHTQSARDAQRLAAEAVREGFEVVVAAGGDGTLNEVLNGIASEPGGLESVRLGHLPLGTVNVFAKELGIPINLAKAWQVLMTAKERRIDLGVVELAIGGRPIRHFFAQMAGAGLDARAIELVDWKLKKKLGPLAYVWAGLKALREPAMEIEVSAGTAKLKGALVLVGNGVFYGGKYRIFPKAQLDDGFLEIRVFPKIGFSSLLRCAGMFVFGAELPESVAPSMRAESFTLTSHSPASVEVDGELLGRLPAGFNLVRNGLRVIVP